MFPNQPNDQIRQQQNREGQRRVQGGAGQFKPNAGKHIPKGHDAILKRLQDEKCLVEVLMLDRDDPIVGVIVGRDKFTITVAYDGYEECIYKHAIASFKRKKVQ